MKKLLLVLIVSFGFLTPVLSQTPNAWINEFHYDNSGTDEGEFVEIVIENASSYTLSNFQVDLYNGSSGVSYGNKTVDNFTQGNTVGNYTFFYWEPSSIQNGPDGIALSYNGTLISGQFLSYEGSFSATDGPANGQTSTDVGVSESSTTPTGQSLQLSGTGTQYSDFSWQSPATATKGAINNGQTFGASRPGNPTTFLATTVSISEIHLSWAQNGSSDNVMVAWSSDGTFGTPTDGSTYVAGNAISEGGTVIYNGNALLYNHTGLLSGTHYYYKAWSVDGSDAYSSGVISDATTIPKILITEIMQNPSDVTDANGEWFEIYNYGTSTVDINGYVIKDAGTDSHTINNGRPLNIAAGSFLVLGKNSTTSTNGGVPVDYQYSGITLGNGADAIILYMTDGTTEVDRVEWDGGTNWPDPAGASMIFTGQPTDDNNIGSNWTTSVKRENNFSNPGGTETDKGSPGKNGLYQNLISTTTWSGTGNWNEGNGVGNTNWSNGSPGNKTSVIIDGSVTIEASTNHPAKSKDLSINSGKSLSIPAGSALSVSGNLTNNGTLTVQSSSSGNGSLIVDGTVSGSATVQRYVTYKDDSHGWHEIGCPVNTMTVSGSSFDPGTDATKDLYKWNEANNIWDNYKANIFNFAAGHGYLMSNKNTDDQTFTGMLNADDVSVSLTYTTTSSGGSGGWNLLGNPFPSAIKWYDKDATNHADWGTDIDNSSSSTIGSVAQVWSEDGGTYVPVNAGDIIPSTNGFFVQATANATLTIPASARTHNTAQNNYKKSKKLQNTLTFKITDDTNGDFDINRIGFNEQATEQWDAPFDAHKLMGSAEAPQLWSVSKREKFSQNYLPLEKLQSNYDIPLHFKPGVSTVYHLSVKGVDSFSGTSFVLEDLKTGDKIDLGTTKEYDFSAEKGDDVNRFVLHINGVTAVPDINETDGIQVFSSGKTVYLHGQNMLNGKISIFNTLGQKVYEGLLNGTAKQQIRVNQHKGIYFVKVEENNHVFTKKVFIQ